MIYQESDSTCGNACVRNVLYLVNKDNFYKTYPINESCDSFKKIIDELSKNNIIYEGYEIIDLFLLEKKYLPAIIQVTSGNKLHFVVLLKIGKKRATIIDPQFGKIYISKKKLLYMFTNKVLIKKEVKKNKIKNKKLSYIKFHEKLVYLFIILMQISIFSFLAITMNKDDMFIIKVILIASLLMMIIFHNIYNQKLRHRLNVDILLNYAIINKNRENIIMLSKILDKKVIQISNITSYSIAILMSLVFLCSNGLFETLLALIALSFSLFKILIKPYLNEIRRESSNYEEYAFNNLETNTTKFLSFFSKAQKKASSYQKLTLFPLLIEFALLSSIIIITMTSISSNYINYFLFYIFLPISLNESISKLVDSINLSDEICKDINSISFDLVEFKTNNSKFYYNIGDENMR